MISSLLGKKLGMTQVYDAQNVLVPVTVVEAGPCSVVQVKTAETDGYNAVQIGFSSKKTKNTSKAELAHAKKGGLDVAPRVLSEVRLPSAPTLKVGDIVNVTSFVEGQFVDVIGVTKGKGFQGVMKRWNMRGGGDSHGHSVSHRAPGSIGFRTDPGKVFKGKHMSGHMGARRVTVQNIEVVEINEQDGYMLLLGAIPGHRNALVEIRIAVKG